MTTPATPIPQQLQKHTQEKLGVEIFRVIGNRGVAATWAKQRELLQQVQASVKAVIQAYGEKKGYDFIFTDASIAYASDAVNVTQEILKELQK